MRYKRYILVLHNFLISCWTSEVKKEVFCSQLKCDRSHGHKVCGIKPDGNAYRLKLFANECELLKYGCAVTRDRAYGLISMEYCEKYTPKQDKNFNTITTIDSESSKTDICPKECPTVFSTKVCGIRVDTERSGFIVSLFNSVCEMENHNCINQMNFTLTQEYLCYDFINTTKPERIRQNKVSNKIVVIHSDADFFKNINESVDQFFSATHFNNLTIKKQSGDAMTNLTRRGIPIPILQPLIVFTPWTTKPQNVSEDIYHEPLLNTCFHKCPEKCPETYNPVCGYPGSIAREPALAFKNHCMMDMAQCKMYWEDKSPTALSSTYTEMSFFFCVGEELNNLYRFVPVLRTLQKMGRVRSKGHYKRRLQNMRFINDLLVRDYKIMGK